MRIFFIYKIVFKGRHRRATSAERHEKGYLIIYDSRKVKDEAKIYVRKNDILPGSWDLGKLRCKSDSSRSRAHKFIQTSNVETRYIHTRVFDEKKLI